MVSLPLGTLGESSIIVDTQNVVSFFPNGEPKVLGTPYMIFHMEMTARNSIKPLLDEGFDTVGTRVDVRHLAATPIGMRVTFHSELIGVEDRRLLFKVTAFDDREKIGEGTHERGIVHVGRFTERLQAKGSPKG